ncbi:SAM-dependent methyltransferase [Bremerella sp. T1]|uniref:SAM-dependent methyltransferase n=1 Tax=Bremerella sp. TYQ1 TaxID=3119568 RepID=UPI001CCC8A77|nr:class I SAM-dependent methyltransferase [Bremerella volcania]UBM35439.1 class I SAM-dependent methyltransferase [Bremerella volcania]
MIQSNESTTSRLPSAIEFFSKDVAEFKRQLAQLESEIDKDAIPQRDDEFHKRTLAAIEQSQSACRAFEEAHSNDPDLVKEVQARFREEIGPWFGQSWFANRAWTKPSGFSGDYAMLVKIYEESTPARGLGAYIDLCLGELPLSQAVRGRKELVREYLLNAIESRQGDIRIMDIACGPCREFLDFPEFEGRNIEVVAMDNDPAALEYIESQVVPQLPSSTTIKPVRFNAMRARNPDATKKNYGTFDIIYSVGLADYLTDEHLIGIFSGLGATLNEGGALVIAFKDTERYDETPYQWHLDWFFYQRTVEDVLNVYDKAGFNTEKMELTRDRTEIIVNYVSKKAEDCIRRLDPAEVPRSSRAGRKTRIAKNGSTVFED